MDRTPASCEEFEITPAMTEAGVIPLLRYHREKDNEDDVVRAIFIAMSLAAKVSKERQKE